jgi:hypothetical protein
MTASPNIPILQKAIDAYGGRSRWARAGALVAEFSAGGLAFVLKRRPRFHRATVEMDLARPFSRIVPIGKTPGVSGVLDGRDAVLVTAGDRVIRRRRDARRYFPGGRRALYWDDLDMAYFANYAMWNYLALPALLMRSDVDWRAVGPGCLEGRFPETLPTHCRRQRFTFDDRTGRLVQHDYTAEVIGRWARAAHVVLAHDANGGVAFTSRRRVTPRSPRGRPLPGPVLIAIRVHRFRMREAPLAPID